MANARLEHTACAGCSSVEAGAAAISTSGAVVAAGTAPRGGIVGAAAATAAGAGAGAASAALVAMVVASETLMPLAAQCKIPPHIAQYPVEIASQRGVSHPFALFS